MTLPTQPARPLPHRPVPTGGEQNAPMGLKVRLFVYLVGVHVIVGFFFLLFAVAAHRH
jgi:hypothetical protein